MDMKKVIMLSALMTVFFAGLQAQSFSTLINEAENLFYRGDFQTAAQEYERALLTGRASEIHYYGAACAWARAGNSDRAIEKLRSAIENGWMEIAPLLNDPDLETAREHPSWAPLIEELRQRVATFDKALDHDLVATLETIEARDQQYRKEMRALEAAGVTDEARMTELEQLQAGIDAENIAEVAAIIDTYGYPGKNLVGNKCEVAFMVIQHSDLETQKAYLPTLEMAADNGDIPWFSLMRMMDRIDTQEGRLQLYGAKVYRRDYGNQIDVYRAGLSTDDRAVAGRPPLPNESRWDVELQSSRSGSNR